MSKAQEIFDKIEKLKLHEFLSLCALLVETEPESKKTDTILLQLETRLQARRLCIRLGIKDNNETT